MEVRLNMYREWLREYLLPHWPRVLGLAVLLFGAIGFQIVNPQSMRLFSSTLRENLLMGAPENMDLEEVVSATVMDEDLEAWPDGIETVIGPKGTKLSGGQIQRAAAACMLVRGTELMILDDLSSALDVKTEQILWERVLAATESTFLVVSHRKAILQRADRVLLVKEGRIIDEGGLEELLGRSAEMRAVLQV